MKTIFHIGTPKTGTTTLQNSLHEARGALARHGILYPSLAELGHRNQHPLVINVLPPEKLPRQFRFRPQHDLDRLASRSATMVAAEIEARRPDHLLLSSEYFNRDFTPEERSRQKALLERFGVSDLVFSVYIRRPSSHYLSLLTQGLRQSSRIRPIQPLNIRQRIENLRASFPGAEVVPAIFEREALVGGDIVTDFVARFLVPIGVARSEVPTLAEANVSVSGESTDILGAFRGAFFPGQDNKPEKAASRLFEELAGIEARLGHRRPRLRPDVAHYLDTASDYVSWLRDAYGLEFPGYDYDCALHPAPERPEVRSLADVIEIDVGYRRQILAELERSRWAKKTWGHRGWVRSVARDMRPSLLT
jgi:hypothetical protein